MLLPTEERPAYMQPHRANTDERFVSVFTHPHGLEARSYYRDDITLDVRETKERLTAQSDVQLESITDRMLEVVAKGEVLEVFLDGRIRCVSNGKDPKHLASLVFEIGKKLVVRL
jgi:hypothetical protein